MKVTEILTGPETWCQGAWVRDERACLSMAVFRATRGGRAGNAKVAARASQMLCEIIAERADEPMLPENWNDAPERTFAEVHAVAAEFDRRWALLRAR